MLGHVSWTHKIEKYSRIIDFCIMDSPIIEI